MHSDELKLKNRKSQCIEHTAVNRTQGPAFYCSALHPRQLAETARSNDSLSTMWYLETLWFLPDLGGRQEGGVRQLYFLGGSAGTARVAGRKDADILVRAKSASRKHAEIKVSKLEIWTNDANSKVHCNSVGVDTKQQACDVKVVRFVPELTDLSSFGSYLVEPGSVDGRSLPKKVEKGYPTSFSENAIIYFGEPMGDDAKFIARKYPFLMAINPDVLSEQQRVRLLRQFEIIGLEYCLLPGWKELEKVEYSHLVVECLDDDSILSERPACLHALAHGKPIVAPDWVHRLAYVITGSGEAMHRAKTKACIARATALPEEGLYCPRVNEASSKVVKELHRRISSTDLCNVNGEARNLFLRGAVFHISSKPSMRDFGIPSNSFGILCNMLAKLGAKVEQVPTSPPISNTESRMTSLGIKLVNKDGSFDIPFSKIAEWVVAEDGENWKSYHAQQGLKTKADGLRVAQATWSVSASTKPIDKRAMQHVDKIPRSVFQDPSIEAEEDKNEESQTPRPRKRPREMSQVTPDESSPEAALPTKKLHLSENRNGSGSYQPKQLVGTVHLKRNRKPIVGTNVRSMDLTEAWKEARLWHMVEAKADQERKARLASKPPSPPPLTMYTVPQKIGIHNRRKTITQVPCHEMVETLKKDKEAAKQNVQLSDSL